MIRSALLRRVYFAVLLALILSSVSVWLLFMTLSNSFFLRLRAGELMPRAQSLSRIVGSYLAGELDEDLLMSMVDVKEGDTSIMNAYLVVADASGSVVLDSDQRHMLDPNTLAELIQETLSGRSVLYVLKSVLNADIVTLGVPVEKDGVITGALVLYVPQYEAMAARGALAGSLATSMGIVLPAVFLLTYALIYRLVKPLRHMRDVALRMADGHFDSLANEDIPGEIGQLGLSLNRLSRELEQTISALTLERNRLVQILNGLSEGIAAVGPDGTLTHINPALETIFRPDTATDDPRMRAIPRREVWDAFDTAVRTGENVEIDLRVGESDIHCAISPVHDERTRIAGAVGLFRDISNEVRLEATRREYVANVSHEMRTPLTAMRGLIEPLRDGLVTDENAKKRYYDIILREVLRLSRLISDLMELSRLQSGTVSFQPESFEIAYIVYDLAERYGAQARENGIELAVETDFTACPPLFSNPDRVEQVLVILLDNAIKYSPKGGRITLSGEWNDERAVLRVRDTGLGISEENQKHVFERFYKVDKAHSGMGSGLGLSIAHEMLRQMGEAIWVQSEEGRGSEFSFTVKLERSEETDTLHLNSKY